MKTKSFVALTLVALLVFAVMLPALALITEIVGPNTSKAGPNGTKIDTSGDAVVVLSSWSNCAGSIQCYLYKNGEGRATPIYSITSTGAKTMYYLAGMAEQAAIYHTVWKTNSSVGDGVTASVTYTFAA